MKLFSLIFVLCLMLFLQLNVFAQEAKKIPTLSGQKNGYNVDTDRDNNLNIVFSNVKGKAKNSQIFYQKVSSQLETVSKEIRISSENTDNFSPDIAIANNGDLYVVWDGRIDGAGMLFISKSVDGGQSFSEPKIVSSNFLVQRPKIVVDANGNIYVIYLGASSPGIFVLRSNDGGNNFSEPKKVSSDNDMFAIHSSIVFDSKGTLYLFYSEGISGINYLVTSNDGINFGLPKAINEGETNFFSFPKAVIDKKDNIYVAFGSLNGILFIKSLDQGQSFSPAIRVADSIGVNPDIMLDSQGNIIIAWQESKKTGLIAFSRSNDLGITFSLKQILSKNLGSSFSALINRISEKTFISWISRPNKDSANGSIFITNIK